MTFYWSTSLRLLMITSRVQKESKMPYYFYSSKSEMFHCCLFSLNFVAIMITW